MLISQVSAFLGFVSRGKSYLHLTLAFPYNEFFVYFDLIFSSATSIDKAEILDSGSLCWRSKLNISFSSQPTEPWGTNVTIFLLMTVEGNSRMLLLNLSELTSSTSQRKRKV